MDWLKVKKNATLLWRGLKRVVTALFTAGLFGLSVYALIATATATGYGAVVLFVSGIVQLKWAFRLLKVQGTNKAESDGDIK
jgi:hypothetical protein